MPTKNVGMVHNERWHGDSIDDAVLKDYDALRKEIDLLKSQIASTSGERERNRKEYTVEAWKREAVKNRFVTKLSTEVDDDDLEALMQRPDVSEYISSIDAFINEGICRPLTQSETESALHIDDNDHDVQGIRSLFSSVVVSSDEDEDNYVDHSSSSNRASKKRPDKRKRSTCGIVVSDSDDEEEVSKKNRKRKRVKPRASRVACTNDMVR